MDHPKIIRSDFMSSLGTCLVTWASFEAVITMIIDEIYENHNGKIVEPERPRTAFVRKIKFLEKWHKNDKFIAPVMPWVPSHLKTLKPLANTRNLFAHGIYTSPEKLKEIANIDMAAFTGRHPITRKTESQTFDTDRLDKITLTLMYSEGVWRSLFRFLTNNRDSSVAHNLPDALNDVAKQIALNDVTKQIALYKAFLKDLPNL